MQDKFNVSVKATTQNMADIKYLHYGHVVEVGDTVEFGYTVDYSEVIRELENIASRLRALGRLGAVSQSVVSADMSAIIAEKATGFFR